VCATPDGSETGSVVIRDTPRLAPAASAEMSRLEAEIYERESRSAELHTEIDELIAKKVRCPPSRLRAGLG
jgi:hypothetical protein